MPPNRASTAHADGRSAAASAECGMGVPSIELAPSRRAELGKRQGRTRAARRLDVAALESADRLLRVLLQGLCALTAVLALRELHGTLGHSAWVHWRSWAVLFPAGMLLVPSAMHSPLGQPRLGAVLDVIGLALKSALVILALQLLLWVAGHAPVPVSMLGLLFAINLLFCQAVRALASRLTRHWRRSSRVVIVGADEQGIALADHVRATAANVEIVGFVDDRRSRVDVAALPAPFLGSAAEFMLHERDVDGIVIALPNGAAARVETLAATLRRGLVNIYLAPETPVLRRSMLGRQSGGLETLMLLGMDRLPLTGRIVKRLFDIVFASAALLLFLPFGLVIAALIKWESPGPVIFRQQRYGLGNSLFEVYKFRSMRYEPKAAPGEIRLTERGDSRVTRVGDFLRRSSLDEFPQFFNVLRGDMSVVGPRPHPPGVKAGGRIYEDVVADFMERYKMLPGITGWAQVNGLRGNTFTENHLTRRFAFDIQYMRNWSFELDLWIVIKTVWGGFGGSNAF
ncbi:MAG TPA: exopolysaccharide biosynthesis polyprenyl glycosylphosphotransferase [Albitalea sp.]|uniref:exopolysaccharide biosynthesis polyprenyl glycosylphosphotransferase n=1 Tax=Piscinibacter sp. TaxID=1903157 RepID=UPI002ED290E9